MLNILLIHFSAIYIYFFENSLFPCPISYIIGSINLRIVWYIWYLIVLDILYNIDINSLQVHRYLTFCRIHFHRNDALYQHFNFMLSPLSLVCLIACSTKVLLIRKFFPMPVSSNACHTFSSMRFRLTVINILAEVEVEFWKG